jgi:hypothetical protein
MSHSCRLCCKSLKTPGDKFPARRRNKPRSLINVVSGSLPKPPVSLSPGDEVPHMFTRKPLLQPEKFAVDGAKRLLQHNLPLGDICTATNCNVYSITSSARASSVGFTGKLAPQSPGEGRAGIAGDRVRPAAARSGFVRRTDRYRAASARGAAGTEQRA